MEQRHIYCESIRLIRIQKYYIADWLSKWEPVGYFYARIFKNRQQISNHGQERR